MIYFDQKLNVMANVQRQAVRVSFGENTAASERVTLSLSSSEARTLASELLENTAILDQHHVNSEIGEALKSYQNYLASLVTGIERWVRNAEGVPAETREGTQNAKAILGEI